MSQMQQPQADRLLDVGEIFKSRIAGSSNDNSLDQVDDYIKTLPDMIPEQSKLDIIAKIIVAANLDKNVLISDGERRMDILRGYAKDFSANTDSFVSSRLYEVEKLEQRTSQLRDDIKSRHELQEKQITVVNNEMQRLNSIISFLSGL